MAKSAYGIDFGTTNSTVSIYTNGRAKVLPIDPEAVDPHVFRSVLYIKPDSDRILYGNEAITSYIKDVATQERKVRQQIFTGRFIKKDKDILGGGGWAGTEMVPEMITVDIGGEGRLMMSLKSAASSKLLTNLNIFGKFYSIEMLLGMILAEIKTRADALTGENVTSLVLGRPVRFVGDNEKKATGRLKEAAKFAGFNEVHLEYEPIGAAWDYGNDLIEPQTILVFDFGGGTLDLSIVSFPDKKIIANDGVAIGGDLLDRRLFEKKISKYFGTEATFGKAHLPLPESVVNDMHNWYTISQLKTESYIESLFKLRDASSDREAINRYITLVNENLGYSLYDSIDKAKLRLSEDHNTKYEFKEKNIDIEETIGRWEFEAYIKKDLLRIEQLIEKIIKDSKVDKIDAIVTTGGSSLIPIVRQVLEKKIGKDKIVAQNTFTSVSKGLALRAGEVFNLS